MGLEGPNTEEVYLHPYRVSTTWPFEVPKSGPGNCYKAELGKQNSSNSQGMCFGVKVALGWRCGESFFTKPCFFFGVNPWCII